MNNKNTRNLLLVSNYPSDTAYAWWLMEHFWASIAEHFTKLGCKVYLAYPEVSTVSKTITDAPINVIELSVPWSTEKQKTAVQKFIREEGITLIYFTDQPYFNFQYASLKRLGIKHIVNHDHTPGDRPPVKGIKGLLKQIKNALPWFTTDKFLCVSAHMRKRNIHNARIPADKCRVVQNGIRPVNCEHKRDHELRKELIISDEDLLVITTGRAAPYKRFDFIIDTAKEYMELSPSSNVIFLLVGDGPAMQELQQQIHKLNLEKNVRLMGYRNDVRDLLCLSDIAMHAAMGEGFSLSIIEYMSAGLPALVPDITSVSQATTHEKTGIVYKKDDAKAAALHIAELANDEDYRLAMGQAAKAVANKHYTLELCTDTLIKEIMETYCLNETVNKSV